MRRPHTIPVQAIRWCLDVAAITPDGLDAIVLNGKPVTAIERRLVEHARAGFGGLLDLVAAIKASPLDSLRASERIAALLDEQGPSLSYVDRQESGAAIAFYPSPFERAAILTVDSMGDRATSIIAEGVFGRIDTLSSIRAPDSIELFHAAIAEYCGFTGPAGALALMRLAGSGQPVHRDALLARAITVFDDGSVRLDRRYVATHRGRQMFRPKLAELLGVPPRAAGSRLDGRHADIAASAQAILEDALLRMAQHAHDLTRQTALCLGGSVALNTSAVRRLARDGPFEQVFVPPAPDGHGGSVGAALWWWHQAAGAPRAVEARRGLSAGLLGPRADPTELSSVLGASDVPHEVVGPADLARLVVSELSAGRIVGWRVGRAELGPPATGNSCVLADPRAGTAVDRLVAAIDRGDRSTSVVALIAADAASDLCEVPDVGGFAALAIPRRRPTTSHGSDPIAQLWSRLPDEHRSGDGVAAWLVSAQDQPELHAVLIEFARCNGAPVLLAAPIGGTDQPAAEVDDLLHQPAADDVDVLVVDGVRVRMSSIRERAS